MYECNVLEVDNCLSILDSLIAEPSWIMIIFIKSFWCFNVQLKPKKWDQSPKSLAPKSNSAQEELLDFEGEPQMGLWRIFSLFGWFFCEGAGGAFKQLLPTTIS